MKNQIIYILLCLFFCGCSKNSTNSSTNNTNSTINFDITEAANIGFASLNGGTTGGTGGDIVTATTFNELKSYLENTTRAYIVKVEGRIYNNNKGGSIRVRNNKTLVGTTANAFLDGIGLTISANSNVIVRNIKFTLTSVTDRTDPAVYSPTGDEGRPQILTNGGDLIRIQNANNVWIDHCEFYNENPDTQTNQDLYDGLIDISGNSAWITISWNYFHDHHKVHLIGSADTDNFDRRTTFAFNYYKKVRQRLPSFRFGTAHIYNNYYNNIGSSGINSRMGACVRVENNVFETARSPIVNDGSPTGQFALNGNIFTGITGTAVPTTSTCSTTIPYNYSLISTDTLKNTIINKAGVGKL